MVQISAMIATPYRLSGAIAVLVLAASPLRAQTYSFTPVMYRHGVSTGLQAINAAGAAVGNYSDSAGNLHCIVLHNGKYRVGKVPGASQTNCWGINKAGEIVGDAIIGNAQIAFLYTKGTYTTLPLPDSSNGAIAYGISDTGIVVGTYADSNNNQHGFTYDTSTRATTSFDVPGAFATAGIAINTNRDITVQAYDSNGNTYSYLLSNGAYTSLNFPQGTATYVHGINNAGLVVMGWLDSNGQEHGGVLNTADGIYYIADYPGSGYTEIHGINVHDEIVGSYAMPNQAVSQGFLATGKVPKQP
jgi:probable HAF family extracellular repeat protein